MRVRTLLANHSPGMWHSDRPQTQQKLANSLASLVDDMRAALFGPFLSAFWTTLATNFHLIDSLRLDKFLLLMRKYVNVAFSYLDHRHWPPDLTAEYLQVIQDVLLEDQGKISDGIRYHIFDVWIDELEAADQDRKAPLKEIMGVIDKVEQRGRTKILKTKAREALADGRLSTWTMARRNGEEPEHSIDFRG